MSDDAPVPPEPTARGDARVKTPAVSKVEVAVAPKYARYALSCVDEARLNCCSPVQVLGFARLMPAVTAAVSEPEPEMVSVDAPESASVAT